MIEDYDRAVETALERGEDPEEYLRFKTRQREAEQDPLQLFLAKCAANVTA